MRVSHPPAVQVRGVCDLRCAWCNFEAAEPRSTSGEASRVSRELESLRAQGRSAVTLGLHHTEPTTHPSLPEIVSRARALGFTQIVLSTSGMLISEERRLEDLRDCGLTDVVLTVIGPEGELSDLLLGRAGAAASKLRAIEACRELGLQYFVAVALLRPMLRALPELFKDLRATVGKRGTVHALYLDSVSHMAMERVEALWPTAGELIWTMGLLREIWPGLELRGPTFPSCLSDSIEGRIQHTTSQDDFSRARLCGGCTDERCFGLNALPPLTQRSEGVKNLLCQLRPMEPPVVDIVALRELLTPESRGGPLSDELEGVASVFARIQERGRSLRGFFISHIWADRGVLRVHLRSTEGGPSLTVLLEPVVTAERWFLRGRKFAISYSSETSIDREEMIDVLRAIHTLVERLA